MQTALALRQAIWRKPDAHWTIFGIPEVLYTDNGSDFTSTNLEQVAADIKMRLIFSTPGHPRGRGRIERFFETVNQIRKARGVGGPPPLWLGNSVFSQNLRRVAALLIWPQRRRNQNADAISSASA